MSDTESNTEDAMGMDEFTLLKNRARLMGITHSNNISLPTLRAKIAAHVEGAPDPEIETQGLPKEANPLIGETEVPVKVMSIREYLRAEEEKLIRLRITNLDPKKKNLPGEIFTTGNEYLGTIRKFVPYGEVTDEGYHVPNIIYKMMANRRFLDIRTSRDPVNGREKVSQQWVKEFALEILDPLTREDLARLANAQAAAGVGSSTEE